MRQSLCQYFRLIVNFYLSLLRRSLTRSLSLAFIALIFNWYCCIYIYVLLVYWSTNNCSVCLSIEKKLRAMIRLNGYCGYVFFKWRHVCIHLSAQLLSNRIDIRKFIWPVIFFFSFFLRIKHFTNDLWRTLESITHNPNDLIYLLIWANIYIQFIHTQKD